MNDPAFPAPVRESDPSATAESSTLTLSTASLALLCSALWGGTQVAIRFSVDDLPPVGMAGLRFSLAFVFMLFWCRWASTGLAIRPHQRRPILVAGTMLFVQISLLNCGISLTNAAHSTIIVTAHPIFVALLAHFTLRGDLLTPRKLLGLAMALTGMAIVVFAPFGGFGDLVSAAGAARKALTLSVPKDAPTLAGDLIVLSSGLLLGVKTVYVKRALAIVEPGKLLLWHDLLAVVLFFAASLTVEGWQSYHFTGPAIIAVFYLGFVVAGFCFAVQTTLLRRHRASQLAAFQFVTPLFGLALSHLLRGDALSPSLLLGGLAVATGVYCVTTAGKNASE